MSWASLSVFRDERIALKDRNAEALHFIDSKKTRVESLWFLDAIVRTRALDFNIQKLAAFYIVAASIQDDAIAMKSLNYLDHVVCMANFGDEIRRKALAILNRFHFFSF